MTQPIIKSAAEIDWSMAEKAARAILKQCEDAAYAPPEAVHIHQMRIGYVCAAMDSIADGLRLRKRSDEDRVAMLRQAEKERDQARTRIHELEQALGEACDGWENEIDTSDYPEGSFAHQRRARLRELRLVGIGSAAPQIGGGK